MTITDVFRVAMTNLYRSRSRTLLTILGMIVGTVSVVIMISLGVGVQQSTYEAFAETGSLSTISLSRFSWSEDSLNGTEVRLDEETVKKLSRLKNVKAVMPLITVSGILKSGNYVCEVVILAYEDSYAPFDFVLETGRMPEQKSGNGYEIVLPYWVFENFHSPGEIYPAVDVYGEPKVDQTSRITLTFDPSVSDKNEVNMIAPSAVNTYSVSTVGMMSENDAEYGFYCFMNKKDLQQLCKENSQFVEVDWNIYDEIAVKCSDYLAVNEVKDAINALGYETTSLQDAIDAAQKNTNQTKNMLGAIGIIAALVAAIGIVNTMLMNVMERSKELGVYKVIGCATNNIFEIYIVESALVGLVGGVLGVVMSYTASYIINAVMEGTEFVSIIPAYLPFLAILFAIVLSVLAGLYPSIKAMRQSPLTAIRRD